MSRVLPEIEPTTHEWLDKNAAAKYLNFRGFHTITANSIVHASSRLNTLHEGKRVGKAHFWRREWLDAWIESL